MMKIIKIMIKFGIDNDDLYLSIGVLFATSLLDTLVCQVTLPFLYMLGMAVIIKVVMIIMISMMIAMMLMMNDDC